MIINVPLFLADFHLGLCFNGYPVRLFSPHVDMYNMASGSSLFCNLIDLRRYQDFKHQHISHPE
jgi:hypothetical protein